MLKMEIKLNSVSTLVISIIMVIDRDIDTISKNRIMTTTELQNIAKKMKVNHGGVNIENNQSKRFEMV